MGPAATAAVSILAFLLLPVVMLGHVAAQPYTYTVQPNTNYPFNDIRPSDGPVNAPACGNLAYGDTSPTACETRCNAADACVGFVHVADVNCCFLKSKLEGQNANPSCVTHLKTGSGSDV
ncbi:hypothetical protein KFL_007300070 [Klebsormidium nitens]|uniref:Apple domain-containing protein n=1 Tax=Klebsormidium nitens TaxID=105231 RepID=A0A1Y1IPJ6_KLENI|nr:hypothetical protein KFL_007300070 [Klebsormidium nitens]|eukprot:GAQ91121.1 hypothetical protein KFL_007300070 [Klebsormidium nitens]